MHPVEPKRSWFYTVMGGVVLFAVAVGFGRTYVVPMARGTFHPPAVLHLHGALAMTWVLLFLIQPLLVRYGRVRWHRKLGRIGLPVAIGVAVTMIPAGYYQVTRDAAAGGGATAISAFLGVWTSAAIFLTLVSAGIIARRNREAHARWLLLATLLVAWPAWFRFRHYFPGVPRPDIWFGFVLAFVWIPVAALRDRITRGTVHPVLAWGGLALIVEQSFEVLAFDSPWWRTIAQTLYAWAQNAGLG